MKLSPLLCALSCPLLLLWNSKKITFEIILRLYVFTEPAKLSKKDNHLFYYYKNCQKERYSFQKNIDYVIQFCVNVLCFYLMI